MAICANIRFLIFTDGDSFSGCHPTITSTKSVRIEFVTFWVKQMKLPFFHERNENRMDARSKRVVAVIHCILNQNTRDPGAAVGPAVNEKIVNILFKHQAGIIQLPCPEMVCLGLKRERPKGFRIRDVLDTYSGMQCCRSLSKTAVDQIEEHILNQDRVLGIVGGNVESPGCAVHRKAGSENGDILAEQSGVFMKALEKELHMRGLYIPFLPMRESSPELFQEDLESLDRLLAEQ
jgi:predicted secreted protein